MQLTARLICIDYYPIKTWSNNIIPEKYLRILTFKGQTQTKRIITEAQLNEEITDRVTNYSYNVTDNHTNRPQFTSQIGGTL